MLAAFFRSLPAMLSACSHCLTRRLAGSLVDCEWALCVSRSPADCIRPDATVLCRGPAFALASACIATYYGAAAYSPDAASTAAVCHCPTGDLRSDEDILIGRSIDRAIRPLMDPSNQEPVAVRHVGHPSCSPSRHLHGPGTACASCPATIRRRLSLLAGSSYITLPHYHTVAFGAASGCC